VGETGIRWTNAKQRVVVPAEANGGEGLSGDDLVWLLERAPAEVLILRPAPGDANRVVRGRPVP
jgi:hypothetical protein